MRKGGKRKEESRKRGEKKEWKKGSVCERRERREKAREKARENGKERQERKGGQKRKKLASI